nr:immunoglobulin light chain junction region [Macaca mulatta]MOW51755.1 immunoglobulin light chain junction region [Macaca mulatta]MOW51936.1 immunoglobulin light chain junction region [Macaca mulatta]MOW51980.1 immunoglobulin light chain junction region [Macaca mulatta]MOW52985.1 immunoglobulin light chain junction region [Macaca mulatta]
CLQGYRTPFTF